MSLRRPARGLAYHDRSNAGGQRAGNIAEVQPSPRSVDRRFKSRTTLSETVCRGHTPRHRSVLEDSAGRCSSQGCWWYRRWVVAGPGERVGGRGMRVALTRVDAAEAGVPGAACLAAIDVGDVVVGLPFRSGRHTDERVYGASPSPSRCLRGQSI